jgi:hypothetical protein
MKSPRLFTLAVLSTLLVACGMNPFGPPPRVSKDGFRATAHVDDGNVRTIFEVAVRGKNLRREQLGGGPWSILVVRGDEQKAFELDQATKSWREADPFLAATVVPGHPLTPGFSEVEEARQRGLTEYSRESDTVFAGNACHLWRFDDDPNSPFSASTTYWVSPALENLVVRCDHAVPVPDGETLRRSTELRNVRAGAEPALFEVPKGFQKAEARPKPTS